MNKNMSRMNKKTVFGALLLSIMMLSLGCGGKGLIPDLPPIQPPAQASKGSIEGYVYAQIGSEPVAARVSESAAPPVGHKAVANAAVSAVCGSETKSANTTASGYFAIAQLPVGSCTVTITKAGYGSYSTTVTVQANTITAIGGDAGMSLTPTASGALIVKTNVPGATIYIDGQNTNITMTDTERRIDNLSPGEHTVGLSLAGFREIESVTFSIEERADATIELLLVGLNNKIVFTSERNSVYDEDIPTKKVMELFKMNPDGSEQQRIGDEDTRGAWPSLSIDGSFVVYNPVMGSTQEDNQCAILKISIDGTAKECLYSLYEDLPLGSAPALSYDSKSLVVSPMNPRCETPYDPLYSILCAEIGIFDIKSGNVAILTDNDVADGWARFSPDGKKIVFVVMSETLSDAHIYIMDADGSNRRQLTFTGINRGASFSPDGKKIIFMSARGSGGRIYTMDLDGSNVQMVADTQCSADFPSYSPDGTKIAFSCFVDTYYSDDIFIMNADGSNIQRLTYSRGSDYAPVWTP